MKKSVQKLFVILFAMSIAAGHAYAIAVDETPLANQQDEAKARQIMKGIRCLVCQNQSIEDSNADLAKDLRQIVSSAATVLPQSLWRSPLARPASTPTWSASSLLGESRQTAAGD